MNCQWYEVSEEQLFTFFHESVKAVAERKTPAKSTLEQLDTTLYAWFKLKRYEGASVSSPVLIEKARPFYNPLNLTDVLFLMVG